jgi:hypothetical protein
LLDFPALINHQEKFQRSYVAPNNRLKIYSNVRERGIVNFSDSKVHHAVYTVKDISGNTSWLEFDLKSEPAAGGSEAGNKSTGNRSFKCKVANHFETGDLVLDLPAEALYEDLDFRYLNSQPGKNMFTAIHHLQDDETPMHTFCELSIRPGKIPQNLLSKALIVKVSENGNASSVGGKLENGFIKTRIREFGNYAVMVDTTPPVIRAVNISNNKKVHSLHAIQMRISDNLSGIRSYRGTLNGKWILMDFDAKSGRLVYSTDDRMKPGKNEFRLVVKDATGNEAHYKAVLIR